MSKSSLRRSFLRLLAVGAAVSAVLYTSSSALADYKPGTYSAEAQGIESMVKVTMTFDEASIVDVVVDSSNETPGIGQAAAEDLAKLIKDAQGSDFEAVSGATVTSEAAQKAAADCIAQAKGM